MMFCDDSMMCRPSPLMLLIIADVWLRPPKPLGLKLGCAGGSMRHGRLCEGQPKIGYYTLVRLVKITRACACVKDGKKPQNLLFLGNISFYYWYQK